MKRITVLILGAFVFFACKQKGNQTSAIYAKDAQSRTYTLSEEDSMKAEKIQTLLDETSSFFKRAISRGMSNDKIKSEKIFRRACESLEMTFRYILQNIEKNRESVVGNIQIVKETQYLRCYKERALFRGAEMVLGVDNILDTSQWNLYFEQ